MSTLNVRTLAVTVPGYSSELMVTVNGCRPISKGKMMFAAFTEIVWRLLYRLIYGADGVKMAAKLQMIAE